MGVELERLFENCESILKRWEVRAFRLQRHTRRNCDAILNAQSVTVVLVSRQMLLEKDFEKIFWGKTIFAFFHKTNFEVETKMFTFWISTENYLFFSLFYVNAALNIL